MRSRLWIGFALAVFLVTAIVFVFFLSGGFDATTPPGPTQIASEPSPSDPANPESATSDESSAEATAPAADTDAEETAAVDENVPPILIGQVLGDGSGIEGAEIRLYPQSEVLRLIDTIETTATKIGSANGSFPDIGAIVHLARRELDLFRRRGRIIRTGPEGRFEARPSALPSGDYFLLTLADRWLFRYGDVVSLEAGETRELTLTLERGRSIAGRVIDLDGSGLGGVRIVVSPRVPGVPSLRSIVQRALRYVNGEFLRGRLETVTDGGGAFEVHSLPDGFYDIVAIDRQGVEGIAESIEAGEREAIVLLGPGALVFGALVDADGFPAVGVEIALESMSDVLQVPLPMIPAGEMIQQAYRLLGDELRKVRSDASGRFTFTGLSAQPYRITIDSPGLKPLVRSFDVDWGQRLDLGAIAVDRGRTIAGVIKAGDGAPVAGARVSAVRRDGGMAAAMGSIAKDFVTGRLQVESASDGTFAISGLGTGKYFVQATRLGKGVGLASNVQAPRSDLEILLEPGVTVRGRVISSEDGSPIAGAIARVRGQRADTDVDGYFVIEDVPRRRPRGPFEDEPSGDDESSNDEPRRASVDAEKPAYLSTTVEFDLDGDRDVEVRLARAPRITGTVLDPDGKPAPGVLVRLVPDMGEAFGGGEAAFDGGAFFDPSLIFFAATVTNLEGRFKLRDFRAPRSGPFRLIADHVSHPRAIGEPFEFEDVPEDGFELRLPPGSGLTGVVTDGKGPVAAATVRLSRPRERDRDESMFMELMGLPKPGVTVTTGADGTYSFEKVRAGDYVVGAEKIGFIDSESKPVTIVAGSKSEIDLQIPPGGLFEGIVKDDLDQPIAQARVRVVKSEGEDEERAIYSMFGGAYKRTTTEIDGRFEVGGLPDGIYDIIVEKEGFSKSRAEQLAPGAKVPVFVLVPAGSLRVRVVDAETALPLTEYRISVIPNSADMKPFGGRGASRWLQRAVNDPEGIYRKDDLDAGDHAIRVAANAYLDADREARIVPGELTPIEIALVRGGRITGRVLDAETGLAVAGVRVGLAEEPRVPPKEKKERSARRESSRDEDGQSNGSGDESGGASTSAAADPGDSEDEGSEDAAPESQRHLNDFELVGVVDAEADGSFVLDGVPEGIQSVVATHNEYRQAILDGVEAVPGVDQEVVVRLSRGLVASGRVVDASGRGQEDRSIYITGSGDTTNGIFRQTQSGRDGTFRFGGLAAGSYIIRGSGVPDDGPKFTIEKDRDDLEVVIGEDEEPEEDRDD
jgi:hypothetical protein